MFYKRLDSCWSLPLLALVLMFTKRSPINFRGVLKIRFFEADKIPLSFGEGAGGEEFLEAPFNKFKIILLALLTKLVTTQPVQRVHKQIFATDYADVTD